MIKTQSTKILFVPPKCKIVFPFKGYKYWTFLYIALSQSLKSDNLIGNNREKSNIAKAIAFFRVPKNYFAFLGHQ